MTTPFVVKIVVSKDGFDWYLRFDGDPDKPLHCQLQGKRKTNTKIMIAEDISPAMDNSATGCHQGLRSDPIANPRGAIHGDLSCFLIYSNSVA